MRDIRLLRGALDPAAAIAGLTDATPSAGGIASFVGKVRVDDEAQEPVAALELSHYEPLTLPGMTALGEAAWARFGLCGLVMLHRIGQLAPGDPIVCVATAARHRRGAILAVDYCMDHLKSAAWFWKRERRGDRWHWIEPRAQDHEDLARWSEKKRLI